MVVVVSECVERESRTSIKGLVVLGMLGALGALNEVVKNAPKVVSRALVEERVVSSDEVASTMLFDEAVRERLLARLVVGPSEIADWVDESILSLLELRVPTLGAVEGWSARLLEARESGFV